LTGDTLRLGAGDNVGLDQWVVENGPWRGLLGVKHDVTLLLRAAIIAGLAERRARAEFELPLYGGRREIAVGRRAKVSTIVVPALAHGAEGEEPSSSFRAETADVVALWVPHEGAAAAHTMRLIEAH
jgi:hypothetical protein